jgi:hypothetical protein
MSGNIWWIGPGVIFLLRILYSEARASKVGTSGNVLVFRFAVGVRLLVAFSTLAVFISLIQGIGHEDSWVLGAEAGLVILFSFAWPSVVLIDSKGITRSVWWKPGLHIPWERVVGIEKNSSGDWKVYGSDGEIISFSRFQSDPGRFEREVLTRAKLKGVTDANSPSELPHA